MYSNLIQKTSIGFHIEPMRIPYRNYVGPLESALIFLQILYKESKSIVGQVGSSPTPDVAEVRLGRVTIEPWRNGLPCNKEIRLRLC